MDIKASDIKALREKTGAGMLDCKKALEEFKGDFALAEEDLKKKGMAAVEKRQDREVKEGKVFVKVAGNRGVAIQLGCETDFVSRNADFNELGKKTVELAYPKGLAAKEEVESLVRDAASVIKENITLKNMGVLETLPNETMHEYVHGDGKIGVIVKFHADKKEALEKDAVKAFIHDIALHIAAFNPKFVDRTRVPAAYIAEKDELFKTQVAEDEKMKGKPANVIDGILKGKMNKHLAESCLLEQGFVRDEKQTVQKVLEGIAKEAQAAISVADFICFRVGE